MQLIMSKDIINLIEKYLHIQQTYFYELIDTIIICDNICDCSMSYIEYDGLYILHRFCEYSSVEYEYRHNIYKLSEPHCMNIFLPKRYYYTSGMNCKSGYKIDF